MGASLGLRPGGVCRLPAAPTPSLVCALASVCDFPARIRTNTRRWHGARGEIVGNSDGQARRSTLRQQVGAACPDEERKTCVAAEVATGVDRQSRACEVTARLSYRSWPHHRRRFNRIPQRLRQNEYNLYICFFTQLLHRKGARLQMASALHEFTVSCGLGESRNRVEASEQVKCERGVLRGPTRHLT